MIMKKILMIVVCVVFLLAGEALANQVPEGNFDSFISGLFGWSTGGDCLPDNFFNEQPDINFDLLDIFGILNLPEDNTNPDNWLLCDLDLPPIDLSCFDDLWDFWNHNCHPTPPPCSAPEPASLLLFGVGLIGMAGVRRKLRK